MSSLQKSFLFLQGPSTSFFNRLAERLRAQGYATHRINFCSGDALYWSGNSVYHFRGTQSSFQDFLDEKYKELGITDQVLFGDRRPLHCIAVEHAKRLGIRTHVFEEGYFRPYWITLERDGVNGHSLLPRDPSWYYEAELKIGEMQDIVKFRSPFSNRAVHDVAYHLAGAFNPLLYPYYRTHAPLNAAFEYAGLLKRFAMHKITAKKEQAAMDTLISSVPYFVLPLQLNSDAQIRDHSPFAHMGEVIEYVIASFAHHAPLDAHLIIKNHPLDVGFMPYAKMIQEMQERYHLKGRVHFFDSGNLVTLVENALGMVTVNSTSGMVALEHGIPMLSLSDPIYNIPGLTAQCEIDQFWSAPLPPDMEFFQLFKNVILHTTQINGGFYCKESIDLGVENASKALVADKSPLEMLL